MCFDRKKLEMEKDKRGKAVKRKRKRMAQVEAGARQTGCEWAADSIRLRQERQKLPSNQWLLGR